MGSVKFSGWPKGMDNIHADHDLPEGALRRVVNGDVSDSGKIRRRRGFTQALAQSGAHSLHSDLANGAVFVAGNVMKRFNPDGTTANLGAVPTGANLLAYEAAGNSTYFMSPATRGKLTNGVLGEWGVEVPITPPNLMLDAGALDAGEYHAALTYLLADGRESGASMQASITLDAPGSIAFYGLPIPTQAGVTAKRLYLTTANGEVLYHVATVAAADTVGAIGSFGAELRTQYLVPPPLGTAIAHALGRMFIAKGPIVWFTEALDFDHVDPRKNFYQFPSDVTLIAGTNDGLYVCADQTYFIAGAGTAEARPIPVLGFGAIAGTKARLPTSRTPIWFTERGAVIGKDGGAVEIVSEKLVAPGQMTAAASLVLEQDGLRQFVVVGQNTEASTLQCGSYAEAEIIRREP